MKALRVALTGGIGAGKSLALSAFARLGCETASSDDIARRQARPGGPAHRRLLALFGTADRAAIAARVFRDAAARRRLERATHGLVLAELARRARRARGVFVADVPLLFEARREKDFDVTVAIAAPPVLRLSRVAKRGGISAADAKRRMAAQLTDAARAARADVVIENAGSPKDFVRKIASYHRALRLLQRGAVA